MDEDIQESRFKQVSMFILLSLGTGLLLAAFTQIQGIVKFVFSLGALYLGILAFRRYETWGARIGYIALSLLLFLVATTVIVAILYSRGMLELPSSQPPATE